MRNFKNSFGFTLVELMIVMSVIGILAAVLIPIANNARPDENVMKFKKANITLGNVVRELITSDKYYAEGEFGTKANGENAGKSYFCQSFADVVNSKKVNCDYETTTTSFRQECTQVGSTTCNEIYSLDQIGTMCDNECKEAEKAFTGDNIGVLTSDDISYFQSNLIDFYGCIIGQTCSTDGWGGAANGEPMYGYKAPGDYVQFSNGKKALRRYKVFCIDVDGINKGEDPFGYGIRADGKIFIGNRAKEWLEKDIQKGKNR